VRPEGLGQFKKSTSSGLEPTALPRAPNTIVFIIFLPLLRGGMGVCVYVVLEILM
jgi:hypothetical protein